MFFLYVYLHPFFFYIHGHYRYLHSFPTRRSSDLFHRPKGKRAAVSLSFDDARTSQVERDRKSTRLNSSHTVISYAVFCLKKKTSRHDQQALRPSTRTLPGILSVAPQELRLAFLHD